MKTCDLCGTQTRRFATVTFTTVVCERCAEVIRDRHANVPDAKPLMPDMSRRATPRRRPQTPRHQKR